ncbi:aminopeptidase P family protein [Frankia sp. AgPm24]|uniref:aminopeptidase P family protein n=1 Tax=Frankia sp. AgPm24 TaxID=631128 RepID=UPI00200F794F|nr:aminopeptidase P family protein [Frankia sp. AgPm24]MCK9922174.1 aminopeptidase P family protein [Frankia sp. AgPm24]
MSGQPDESTPAQRGTGVPEAAPTGRDENTSTANGADSTSSPGTGQPAVDRDWVPGTGREPGQVSHDEEPHAAFQRFMATSWAPQDNALPSRDDCAPYAAKRRALLGTWFPADALVVPTGGLRVRANDTDYPFRPGSDFFWLTGCHEPDAVLVLLPNAAGDHQTTLYVPGRSDRSSSAFYADRRYGELWVGARPGVRETQAALEIECRPLSELGDVLARLAPRNTRVLRGIDPLVDRSVLRWSADGSSVDRDAQLAQVLSELRLVKDDFELLALDDAVAATVRGFTECVGEIGHAMTLPNGERWLEGTFWRRARVDGNDVGYGSIVACGHHATTLHWVRDDGPVRAGELALLDMGVEGRSLYTADVTRTLPITGRFTPVQRRVYDVVLRAQQAGIEAVRPGASFLDPHRAAMRVIATALEDWGLLPGGAQASLSDDPRAPGAGLHRRYTLHSTSHMLGLDVHDCAQARDEAYREGTLAAGMVLTVEPGLYFQPDDLTVPPELRGIGVRIEDDILVTGHGSRNMSTALPRTAEEVENWMGQHLPN